MTGSYSHEGLGFTELVRKNGWYMRRALGPHSQLTTPNPALVASVPLGQVINHLGQFLGSPAIDGYEACSIVKPR